MSTPLAERFLYHLSNGRILAHWTDGDYDTLGPEGWSHGMEYCDDVLMLAVLRVEAKPISYDEACVIIRSWGLDPTNFIHS